MTKPLLAAAAIAAAVALPASAGPSGCVSDLAYRVQHNPVRPLPYGGGGGEPTMVMPGDPNGYVAYDVDAVKDASACIV
ncbi:MAG TPA: hypothetical protein VGX28_12760 [Frankiaceae bacterium]|jgi:hypothetical protein|nr:hypothetical protein [Frankiaceae bacterium]